MPAERRYRQIQLKVASDPAFVGMSLEAQAMWLRISLLPTMQGSVGLMRGGPGLLADEMGLEYERAREILTEIEQAGYVLVDRNTIALRLEDCEPPANPNQVIGWKRFVLIFQDCPVVQTRLREVAELVAARGWTKHLPEEMAALLPEEPEDQVEPESNGCGNGFENGSGNGSENGSGNTQHAQHAQLTHIPSNPDRRSSKHASARARDGDDEGREDLALFRKEVLAIWRGYSGRGMVNARESRLLNRWFEMGILPSLVREVLESYGDRNRHKPLTYFDGRTMDYLGSQAEALPETIPKDLDAERAEALGDLQMPMFQALDDEQRAEFEQRIGAAMSYEEVQEILEEAGIAAVPDAEEVA